MKPISFAGKCSGPVAEIWEKLGNYNSHNRNLIPRFSLPPPSLLDAPVSSWDLSCLGWPSAHGAQSSDDSHLNSWSRACSTILWKTFLFHCVYVHTASMCVHWRIHIQPCVWLQRSEVRRCPPYFFEARSLIDPGAHWFG